MSAKNFVSYGDAETLFTEIENKLNTRLKQVTAMPTANADNAGKIVQYIGADQTSTNPYLYNGKMYKCKLVGSTYTWVQLDMVSKSDQAMYSECWGGIDSKSELVMVLNDFEDDLASARSGDCDINKHMALYSCYIDTPFDDMPSGTQVKAYYDDDAGWVYRAYSTTTAEDFAIIPTGEAPNITAITISKLGGGTLYADNPIGSIVPYGGATAPSGWLFCNGIQVSKTTYSELYAVIGDSFKGDKADPTSGNFYLPDLREVTLKGIGTNYAYGINNHGTIANVGGFIEDRVQDHVHDTFVNGDLNYPFGVRTGDYTNINYVNADPGSGAGWHVKASTITNGRHGATTEVKAVGVNYIIKAEHTPVPADFMDAVEEAVVENNEYSTTETVVGRWINGKPIYRKIVDIGALPNASSKSVNHGISSLESVVRTYGMAGGPLSQLPLPFVSIGSSSCVQFAILGATIDIYTGVDRSEYTGWVAIEYTKTTD